MNTIIWLTVYLIVGIILGLFYFGGLWFTVQNLNNRPHPFILLIASLFIRMAIVLTGLYLILQQGWIGLVMSLIGFITMRVVMILFLKPHSMQIKKKVMVDNGIQS